MSLPWRRGEPKHARRKGPRHAKRPAHAPGVPGTTSNQAPSSASEPAAGTEAPTGERRLRRHAKSLWALLATIVGVVVLFVGVFPTRTFLAQRSAIARAEDQLEGLAEENERLSDEADALRGADEVERMAREEYELIRPGERPFVVLEPTAAGVDLPAAWPFAGLADSVSPPR